MLIPYRRHQKDCPRKEDGRKWRRCKCPIHVDGTLNGKPIKPRSLKIINWDKAVELVHEWEARGYIDEQKREESPVLVSAAVDQFLDYLESNLRLKARTVENYRSTLLAPRDKREGRKRLLTLLQFCEQIGIHSLSQITLADLEKLQGKWATDKASTANNYTMRVKSFWTYLFERKIVQEDFCKKLKLAEVDTEAGEPFTPEQMIEILRIAKRSPRDYAMVMMLRYSGLRIGDAIIRPVSSLGATGEMVLRQKKPGTYVKCVLPPHALAALASFPHASREFWFWNGTQNLEGAYAVWWRRLKSIFREAGVPWGHPHTLRDTFAVEYLLSGLDIDQVSELLGHANILVTQQHYLKW